MADTDRAEMPSVWTTYHVVERDDTGDYAEPVAEALKFHAPQAQPAIAKMQKVQEIGWPQAKEQMHVGGRMRKKAIVRPDNEEPIIWELKCTPHAWRLFFYIFEHSINTTDRRIIYLHASYKKTRGQDYGEVAIARTRRGPGTSHPATREFEFPERSVRSPGIRPALGQ